MAAHSVVERVRGFLRRAFAEPLILFLAIGVILFLVFTLTADPIDDQSSHHIAVDREAVLGYMQARAGNSGAAAENRLNAMPSAELAQLADDYVREEAMYREAVALGLDRNDYLIRQRLVQSLRFMFRNLGEAGEPSLDELQAFYEANRSRYVSPAAITFTHIFFDADVRGLDAARTMALRTRNDLNSRKGAPFAGEPWPGDRFAYGLNYADRVEQFIAGQFGKSMASALFDAAAEPDRWQGPFFSESGVHLVRIERLSKGTSLPFEAVRDEVTRDHREWQSLRLEKIAVDNLVRDYDVAIAPDLRVRMSGKADPR
jgi:hypothetical protein